MKKVILICLIFVSVNSFTQNLRLLEKKRFYLDTFLSSYNYDFSVNDSMYQNNRKNFNLDFSPHLVYSYEDKKYAHQTGLQVNFFATYQNYFDFNFHYKTGLSNINSLAYESNLQSKAYFYHKLDSAFGFFQDLRFRFIWRTNKFINLHFGIDKSKIGEGSRSLFAGNEGISYPFLMLKTNLWKFEYIYIHQILREGKERHYVPKGNAQHLLQFNWNKKFSIALFENVGYLIKDTLYNRGIEWEYFNPLIFFRPQEYSLGSSDNVNIGLQFVLRFKKNILYTQFLIDEFSLIEMKARTRWQHNKYAFQIGFKKEFIFNKNRELFWRMEASVVRPYTFSHRDYNTSYSNQGLALAHVLGSNFIEFFNEFYFTGNWFNSYLFIQAYMKGNDINGSSISYGGDVLKPYVDKPDGQVYGFYIGNGQKTYRFQMGLRFEKKIISKRWNLFVEPRLILEKRSSVIVDKFYFTIGLSSSFLQDLRNY